jgi:hypothetical protein
MQGLWTHFQDVQNGLKICPISGDESVYGKRQSGVPMLQGADRRRSRNKENKSKLARRARAN